MHNVLYLTPAEQQLFAALPEALRSGWKTEAETQSYRDSAEKRQVRLDLMELDDGRFEEAMLECGPVCTEADLRKLIAKIDLRDLREKDLWEICFALGPDAIGYLICRLLADTRDDNQLEGIMAFSQLRHELLASLQPK